MWSRLAIIRELLLSKKKEKKIDMFSLWIPFWKEILHVLQIRLNFLFQSGVPLSLFFLLLCYLYSFECVFWVYLYPLGRACLQMKLECTRGMFSFHWTTDFYNSLWKHMVNLYTTVGCKLENDKTRFFLFFFAREK